MEHISTYKELKDRIEFLELRTKEQKQELKVRLNATYESLKPQNLLKNAFTDATGSPEVRNNILNTSVGLLTGIITNKILIGGSAGIIKKLAGTAVQFGITKFIANNFPAIKEKAEEFIQKRKERRRQKNEEERSSL